MKAEKTIMITSGIVTDISAAAAADNGQRWTFPALMYYIQIKIHTHTQSQILK